MVLSRVAPPPGVVISSLASVNGVSLPPASLLASWRRPITALTTADQENLDQLCLIFVRELVALAGLEPHIASSKLNRSQTRYAHSRVTESDRHNKAVGGSTLVEPPDWVETTKFDIVKVICCELPRYGA